MDVPDHRDVRDHRDLRLAGTVGMSGVSGVAGVSGVPAAGGVVGVAGLAGAAGRVGHDDDDPVGPAGAGVPRVSRQALRRRRQIFFGLLLAVVATLAGAVITRDVTAWIAHSLAVLMFVSYIGLLVRHHQRATEQVAKVRYLSPVRAARPAVVVLRSGTAR